MAKVPKQFFIIPDQKIKTASTEMNGNYPFQGGSFVGAGVSDVSNIGDLQVFGTGRPSQLFSKKFLINSGGSIGSATYIWKNQTATDDNYEGEPDKRDIRDPHSPFSSDLKGFGATAFVAPLYNREVCIVGSNSSKNTLVLMYRSLNSANAKYGGGGWTEKQIHLDTSFNRGCDQTGVSANMECQIDAVTMEDGEVLITVRYQIDLDVYSTEDGITWSLKTKQIVSRFINQDPFPNTDDLPRTYGRQGGIKSMKMASSNEFIRILYVGQDLEDEAWYLKVLGSTDRGATWNLIQDDLVMEAGYITGLDRFGFSVVGLRNGQFLLMIPNQNYMMFEGYLAQGNSSFTYQSSLGVWWSPFVGPNQAPRCFLGCDNQNVYAIVSDDVYPRNLGVGIASGLQGRQAEINLFYIDLDQAVVGNSTVWLNMGVKKNVNSSGVPIITKESITSLRGTQRYAFARGKAYNRGDGMALFTGMFDLAFDMNVGNIQPLHLRFGGWDTRPIDPSSKRRPSQNAVLLIDSKQNPIDGYFQKGRLWNLIEWRSCFGAPSGALYASQWSPWSESRSGATRNWSIDRLRLTSYNTSDFLFYEFLDPSGRDNTGSAGAILPTPRFNFGFGGNDYVSAYIWDGNQNRIGTLNGGCLSFKLYIHSGGNTSQLAQGANANPTGVGISIRSYVRSSVASCPSDQCINLNFNFDESGNVQILNLNNRSILPSINLNAPTYSSDLFVEFRIAFRPKFNSANIPDVRDGKQVQMIMSQRSEGSSTWYNSDIVELDTNVGSSSPNIGLMQRIRFGVFPVSNASDIPQVSWKDFKVHAGTDLGTFGTRTGSSLLPNSIRGKVTSSRETLIDDHIKVVWGGAGGSSGDNYLMGTEYNNAFINALQFDSPRIRWSSGVAMETNNGTISAGEKDKSGFLHNGFAVFGTNAKTIRVSYGEGSPYTETGYNELSMKRSTGRITATSGDAMKVSWDSPAPIQGVFSSTAESRKFFAHLSNVQDASVSSPTSYKIDRHYKDLNGDQWLQCAGVTMAFSGSGITMAGTTIEVYSDRGWVSYPPVYGYQKMRVVVNGSQWNPYETSNTKQELYLGSIIVGTTLTLSPVQMSWTFGDTETSNVTINNTRSGSSWGYGEGPSVRKVSGAFQGDVSEQVRRYVRDTFRSVTNFNEYGLVFVLYDTPQLNNPLVDDYFMLGRYDNNIKVDNIGWYYDEEEQNWRPVGNLTLTFTEIV